MLKARMTRREMLHFCMVGGAAATLAACAPASSPTAEPVAKVEATPEQVTAPSETGYEGKFVILSCSDAERIAPMIEDIEETHPGVTVEWRNLTSERYTELFAAAEVAGDQIDILDLNGQDLRRYAVGDRLRDLSDITYKDRFREVALQSYTLKGKLWAVPRGGISGWMFLYNKKAFEKVGVTKEIETYDELLEIAPELKKAGIAPVTHEGKVIYMWPVWHFMAHAQTSKNKSIENTIKTLTGEMKFTDPEQVEALDILNRYARDGMFIDSVNSTDRDGAFLHLQTGKAAIWGDWPGRIKAYREGDFPELELSLMPPLQVVPGVQRQFPGGTGSATCIYSKIAPEREKVALSILDLMTSDKWIDFICKDNSDSVSCNKNVTPSDDPIAIKYANECAPLQVIYEDWIWPPEVTRAFQEHQQAIVAGTENPDEAAQAIQKVLEDLFDEGYVFED